MATRQRAGALRWCNLATVDAAGHPQVRTVILRSISRATQDLCFYTDRRSPKCTDIERNPAISCHFYCSETHVQYRFQGTACVLQDGALWQQHWAALAPHNLKDYASLAPPSTEGIPDYSDTLAEANFALILVSFTQLDWLQLSRTGHTRRRIEWSPPDIRVTDLVP